jgi:hypothetical protein
MICSATAEFSLGLIQTDVPLVFFAAGFNSFPLCPTYTLLHSHGIRYTPWTVRSSPALTDRSICTVFRNFRRIAKSDY